MLQEEEDFQITLTRIKILIDAFRSLPSSTSLLHDHHPPHNDNPSMTLLQAMIHHFETHKVTFVTPPSLWWDIATTTSPPLHYLNEFYKATMIPLLQSLETSLHALDQLPIQPPPPRGTPRRKTSPPLPPPGMISIAQYTDIACLLEYYVYFTNTLLHHLPTKATNNTTTTTKATTTKATKEQENYLPRQLQRRIRTQLPKSLRGRMFPGVQHFVLPLLLSFSSSPSPSPSSQDVSDRHSISCFANIITHARFRPMLLPRHLSDVYYLEFHHHHHHHHHHLDNPNKTSSILPQYFPPLIEGTIVATSLQSLLSIHPPPPWLTHPTSYWLHQLALVDLPSILSVFVHAAQYIPGKTVETAAMHLSYALIEQESRTTSSPSPPPPNRPNQRNRRNIIGVSPLIWKQLMMAMYQDDDDPSSSTKKTTKNLEMAARYVMISILPLLSNPQRYIQDIFHWVPSPPSPPSTTTTRRSRTTATWRGIQRWRSLMPILPPPPYRSHICHLILQNHGLEILLSYLVNLGTTVDQYDRRIQGEQLVQILLDYSMDDSYFHSHSSTTTTTLRRPRRRKKEEEEEGLSNHRFVSVKTTVVYLMKALINSVSEYSTTTTTNTTSSTIPEELLSDTETKQTSISLETIQSTLESQCTILANIVKSICTPKSKNEDRTSNTHSLQTCLGSQLFQLVLLLSYTPSSHNPTTPKNVHLDPCLQSTKAQWVAMSFLPILYETCGISILLWEEPNDDTDSPSVSGILIMIGWIIQQAALQIDVGNDLTSEWIDTAEEHVDKEEKFRFHQHLTGMSEFLQWDMGIGQRNATSGNVSDGEDILEPSTNIGLDMSSLCSTASLCVGLLIALLELGETKRNTMEEDLLSSFLPSLKQLSSIMTYQKDKACLPSSDISTSAELAEMAAHASVLIVSRNLDKQSEHSDSSSERKVDSKESENGVHSLIQKAILDLQSEMPPIRARGAVSILRLARTITATNDELYLTSMTQDQPSKSGLIIELNSSDSSPINVMKPNSRRDNENDTIQDLLKVAIFALRDTESYVYIAAIQAVSAIADTHPSFVLPILAKGLTVGTLFLSISEETNYLSENTQRTLTKSQRIKIAEAIIFAIRRRGEAISQHYKGLVVELLRACNSKSMNSVDASKTTSNKETITKIQTETELFFKRGSQTFDDEDENDMDERLIRYKTGGLVFDVEEEDVVKSCCFMCLSEIICILPPQLLAPHCAEIINLCKNSLQFDSSRPIRRAACLLSGDLYRSILNHHPNFSEASSAENLEDSLFIAVEMVLSNEESLFLSLQQCFNSFNASKGIKPLSDPSTLTRCEEALATRSICEELGILSAARVLANSKGKSHIPRVIQNMLGTDESTNTVRSMNGLKIDDDLHFLG